MSVSASQVASGDTLLTLRVTSFPALIEIVVSSVGLVEEGEIVRVNFSAGESMSISYVTSPDTASDKLPVT